jgi:hypothetical protein
MTKMSNFKMQQSTKRVAATIDDKGKRQEYLAMMMQAQRIAEAFANSRGRDKSADKEPVIEA